MSVVKIPLTNQPNQSFTVTLPVDDTNVTLDFYVYWNRIAEYWQMTLTNSVTQEELINGLPLLKSDGLYQNLLAEWEYLGIGQAFIIPLTSEADDSPGEEDWDTNFVLVWGP